jgi:ABC-2 type transport system ATP-binding protein
MTHAIEARELEKRYPGGVRALEGVSFAVERGSVFGLVGPNGAGKSTIVKIFTTLARPDGGAAHLLGLDVVRQAEQVRRAIGCVNQDHGVDRDATGRQDLTLQGRLHGMRGEALRARVDELLAHFGLAAAADRTTSTYSGGMRRKLDIALGLVNRPQVLFLDEPTTGLDPDARAGLWDEIERLAGDEGMTVLLTTHYLEEAERLAGRLAIVDRGAIVAAGTPEALRSELRGDTVRVEFAAAPEGASADGSASFSSDVGRRVAAAVDGLRALRDVAVDGSTMRARCDDGARTLPALLSTLKDGGIDVVSATVARPSLDDVYLHHTGRTFGAAERESDAGAAGPHRRAAKSRL